jgi:hypothetical protein
MIIHPRHCRSVLTFALALAGIWLVGCTALDTSNVGSEKISTLKPQVGRYYLLPKALITIEGAPDTNGNLLIDASVSLVADSKFRYFLRWRPNVFSEDIFNNIDVDSDGMLTSINYSAEDKTPQILSDLVTTTVNIAKIAKDLGAGLDTGSVKYPPFTYTFDPFDAAETNKVKSQLFTRQNIELQISPAWLPCFAGPYRRPPWIRLKRPFLVHVRRCPPVRAVELNVACQTGHVHFRSSEPIVPL